MVLAIPASAISLACLECSRRVEPISPPKVRASMAALPTNMIKPTLITRGRMNPLSPCAKLAGDPDAIHAYRNDFWLIDVQPVGRLLLPKETWTI